MVACMSIAIQFLSKKEVGFTNLLLFKIFFAFPLPNRGGMCWRFSWMRIIASANSFVMEICSILSIKGLSDRKMVSNTTNFLIADFWILSMAGPDIRAYNLHKLLTAPASVHPQRGKLFPQYQLVIIDQDTSFLPFDILMMFKTLVGVHFINTWRLSMMAIGAFQNSAFSLMSTRHTTVVRTD